MLCKCSGSIDITIHYLTRLQIIFFLEKSTVIKLKIWPGRHLGPLLLWFSIIVSLSINCKSSKAVTQDKFMGCLWLLK